MDYKQRIRYQITRRSFIFGAGKVGLVSLLLARLGYLQLSQKDYYQTMSANNSITAVMIPPMRGKIFDRNNKLLASTVRNFNVVLKPSKNIDIVNETLAKLANVMKLSADETAAMLSKLPKQKTLKQIILFENIPWFQMAAIEEELLNLPGIFILDTQRRYYHESYQLSHVIGYVSALNASEKRSLNLENIGDLKMGKRGIEKSYEELLRGQFGIKEVEVTSRGMIARELSHEASVRGQDIQLTIDLELQKLAYELLPVEGGAILITDVNNGEVLCSASSPAFDSNLLTQKLSHKEWMALQSEEGKPLINRVVQSLYPPGSVFKMITILAALESGIVPEETLFCDGKSVLGNKSFRCWKRTGHGAVNMHQALKYSCNSYIFKIAKRIGSGPILDVAEKMGFGSLTEIDLPSEMKGFLPTPSWKKRRFNQSWSVGDTLNISVGQGFALGTIAQIAQMTNIIATKGVIYPLHFNRVLDRQPTVVSIAPKNFDVVQKAMDAIVNQAGGTAYLSRLKKSPHSYAGKTGTAQVQSKRGEEIDLNSVADRRGRNHAVFTGYGPVDNPRFSVSVIVEHGGGGGSVAAPIAKRCFEMLFKKYLQPLTK